MQKGSDNIYKNVKKQPLVILLAGLPRTGKSTLSRRIARKYGLEHISTDSVRKRIFRGVRQDEFGKGSYTEDRRIVVYDTIYYMSYTLLRHGIGCVLDGTFYKEYLRQKVQRIADRFGAKFVLIEITCPDKLVKKRLQDKKRVGRMTLSDADLNVYYTFKKLYEPIKMPHIKIDMAQDYDKIMELVDFAIRHVY